MDKQPRTIEDVTFPVALNPVYLDIDADRARFRSGVSSEFKQLPNFHAVQALDNGHVFAVVARDYRLFTNDQAISLGHKCFNKVFRLLRAVEMDLFNIVMPSTRSYCHVDFTHPDGEFRFFGDDPWMPFLRVTNSYNRMYALRFELGFCRSICKNGMIFGQSGIELKFHHSLRNSKPKVEFNMRRGELADLEKEFVESLRNLKRFHVPPEVMWPLVCKIFEFPIITEPNDRQKEQVKARKDHVKKLTNKYFEDLGQNGYAALNVLTDYASRPVATPSPELRVNSLQKKAGGWVADFVEAIERREFEFENYLGEYAKLAA